MVQGFEVVNDTTWDRIVRYGFDKVIGPALDTLAREPMSFHYFARAYRDNKRNYSWLLNRELFDNFEMEELERMMKERPELRIFKQRLEITNFMREKWGLKLTATIESAFLKAA